MSIEPASGKATNSPETGWRLILGSFQRVFTFLGMLVTILSLASFIQHLGEVSLAEYAQLIIDFYRGCADAAQWLLFDWWAGLVWPSFVLPPWVIDLAALYAVVATAIYKGEIAFDVQYGRLPSDMWRVRLKLIRSLIVWAPLLPIRFAKYVLLQFSDLRRMRKERQSILAKNGPALAGLVQVRYEWVGIKQRYIVRGLLLCLIPFIGTALFFAVSGLML